MAEGFKGKTEMKEDSSASAINVFAMTNIKECYYFTRIINRINYAIIANPHSVIIRAKKFFASERAGIAAKRGYFIYDLILQVFRIFAYGFFGAVGNLKVINRYLPLFCFISKAKCLKGRGLSCLRVWLAPSLKGR